VTVTPETGTLSTAQVARGASTVLTREFRSGRTRVQLDYRFTVDGFLRFVTICPLGEGMMSSATLEGLLGELCRYGSDLTGAEPGKPGKPGKLGKPGKPDEKGPVLLCTSALTPSDAEPFLAAGFSIRSELTLLTRPLTHQPFRGVRRLLGRDAPTESAYRIIRGNRHHIPAAADIDAEAFGDEWAMDEHDLNGALAATPTSRLHVAVIDDKTVGFAVTGRAGRRGYLQRLAVRPSAQRLGIGRALVNASSGWAAGHDVRRLIVNTQTSNTGALRLYQQTGFVPATLGLVLLQFELPRPCGPAVGTPGTHEPNRASRDHGGGSDAV
jgi:[ribosomal protein S18]-alanine N-acetyltransferase